MIFLQLISNNHIFANHIYLSIFLRMILIRKKYISLNAEMLQISSDKPVFTRDQHYNVRGQETNSCMYTRFATVCRNPTFVKFNSFLFWIIPFTRNRISILHLYSARNLGVRMLLLIHFICDQGTKTRTYIYYLVDSIFWKRASPNFVYLHFGHFLRPLVSTGRAALKNLFTTTDDFLWILFDNREIFTSISCSSGRSGWLELLFAGE